MHELWKKKMWTLYVKSCWYWWDDQKLSNKKTEIKRWIFFYCQYMHCADKAIGKLDKSIMNLVQELKCKNSKCQGWFIISFAKHKMFCEACGMSQ